MRTFDDELGKTWIAEPREEITPRHHGRWYLVFRSQDGAEEYAMNEVRWQTQATAERTLKTASNFELQRRLKSVRARHASNDGPSDLEGVGRGVERPPANVNAG